MKKIIYILSIGLSAGLVTSSCTKKFEPIFEENASQRIETTIKSYDHILKSSQENWLLQYFPEETQKYGGYNFFLKFSDANVVEVSTELDGSGENSQVSNYDIIQSGGPVLTFNTFNTFMHFFANPSSEEYRGKQGDFEFLILSANNDEIKLRGAKTGNKMRLVKTSKSPEQYVADTKKISKSMLRVALKANFGDVLVNASLESGRQLVFEYTDKEGSEILKKVAYIYTDKGIRLYEPVEINKIVVEEFVLEDGKLNSLDGNISMEMMRIPLDFSNSAWKLNISKGSVSKKLIESWKLDKAIVSQAWEGKFDLLSNYTIGNQGGKLGYFMYFRTEDGPFPIGFGLNFSMDENDHDIVNIVKDKAFNPKLEFIFTRLNVNTVLNMITNNSPYAVEDIDEGKIKLTSISNPDVWFIMNE